MQPYALFQTSSSNLLTRVTPPASRFEVTDTGDNQSSRTPRIVTIMTPVLDTLSNDPHFLTFISKVSYPVGESHAEDDPRSRSGAFASCG